MRNIMKTMLRLCLGLLALPVLSAEEPTAAVTQEEARILTPPAPLSPRINGPRVYGVRPGHPFLYRIPCTGVRPIKFSAQKLPAGLALDESTGIISGNVTDRSHKTYEVLLQAQNSHGAASRTFKIVVGETLALTPPMGWNHWYTHYNRITDVLVRQAADAMLASGMADVGYQYVNIDDCWENSAAGNKRLHDAQRLGSVRDASGRILPNRLFPDMKALTDYIHAKGLKAGIYTSPGPRTCGGFEGAYGHEAQDAQQFADWGFDFLKYDWCSYQFIAEGGDPKTGTIPAWCNWKKNKLELEIYQRPYRVMADLLKKQDRDIVFNLCQYGMGDVWKWGKELGGHCWRTGDDLGFELDHLFEVALRNADLGAFNGPGGWNDPDYIQIGRIGGAHGQGQPRPCGMTPNEQYAFMSLWCLLASPLIYSGDMNALDPFTLNVLCNPEVIEIDQDELGRCARVVPVDKDTFLMLKDLADGSKALGLFNRGLAATRMQVTWTDLGLPGAQRVRDLWRQQELGRFAKTFEAAVPRHGGVLIRVWPVNP